MSRRKKRNRYGNREAASDTGVARPENRANLWWSVYEASDRGDYKGYFWLPNLTPSEQMHQLGERAIAERSDWLYKNVGAVKMLIDGLAVDEIGVGLWPKWISGNEPFDRAMTDAYHFANHDARIFSTDGQNDCYTCQLNIRRMIRLYGDCFGQLVRPAPGSKMPQFALYPGYMIGDFGDEKESDGWTRGVKRNANGRPIFYRVLNSEHPTGYQDVPANDMLHFHDPFLPGQVRGVPSLAGVVKKLFRREDIGKALANGTLGRERLGYAIVSQKDAKQFGPQLTGQGGRLETVTQPDGSTLTVERVFGFDAEDNIAIPRLAAGQELKLLESKRPGTAVMEFLDSILREAAWNETYPPEYVYEVTGMRQGTGARLVLQKVKNVINAKREFQLKPQFVHRHAVFFAWMLIRNGYFDNLEVTDPSDPSKTVQVTVPEKNWWKHKIIPPGDMTVDIGREARVWDERVSTNKMSISTYHGLMAEDDADVEDENLAVVTRRLKKLDALNKANGTNFTYFDMWPRTPAFGASDVATGKMAPNEEETPAPKA